MNIFFLDKSPKLSAEYLCDSHALNGKMATEMAQMMSNLYSLERLANSDCPRTATGNIRKHSYPHHPCTKWIKSSLSNFQWGLEHALYICEERRYRTGKELNGTYEFLKWVKDTSNELTFAESAFTNPALAMPEQYINKDPVMAYRNYYRNEKKHLLKYTKRNMPDWL